MSNNRPFDDGMIPFIGFSILINFIGFTGLGVYFLNHGYHNVALKEFVFFGSGVVTSIVLDTFFDFFYIGEEGGFEHTLLCALLFWLSIPIVLCYKLICLIKQVKTNRMQVIKQKKLQKKLRIAEENKIIQELDNELSSTNLDKIAFNKNIFK